MIPTLRTTAPSAAVASTLWEVEHVFGRAPLDQFLTAIRGLSDALIRHLHRSDLTCAQQQLAVLKLCNLLVLRHQTEARNSHLVARPFGLLVDPSNSCNLRCPGCIHLSPFREEMSWPSGFLREETFAAFLAQFGPFATHINMYLSGEPLLNPKTPRLIEMARRYLLHTRMATSMSVEHVDFEALVASGLSSIQMCVDGASRETLPVYRRRGNFALIIANMRALVEARRKLRSATPYLVWIFLVFEHNKHEITIATKMAEDLGLDAVEFARPYAVGDHAPEVQVTRNVRYHRVTFRPEEPCRRTALDHSTVALSEAEIARAFDGAWPTPTTREPPVSESPELCPWLYESAGIDAHGRVIPCCCPPYANGDQVFGQIGAGSDPFNTRKYQFARDHFSRGAQWSEADGDDRPYCVGCEYEKRAETSRGDVCDYLVASSLFDNMPSDAIGLVEATLKP